MKTMTTLNNMFAAMLLMALTTSTSALADTKKNSYNNRHTPDAVVTTYHGHGRTWRDEGKVYRPVIKTCTFRTHRHALAKADRLRGVVETRWNPRTNMLTVYYDARITTSRHIRHAMK